MLNFGRVLLFLNKSSLQSTRWQPHQTRPGALKNSSRTWRRVRHQLGSPPCRMKGRNSQGQNRSIPSWRNKNGCFRKWWYPQVIHFNRDFHYKSSILGSPYFWKHPVGETKLVKLDHVTTIFVSPTNSLKPSKTKPDRNQVIQFNSWPNIDLPDPWRSLTSPLAIKLSGQIELTNAPTKVPFSAQFIARDVGWRWSCSFFFPRNSWLKWRFYNGMSCWYLVTIGVLPWKLTWHWKIAIFNRRYTCKWLFFQSHVSFPGCSKWRVSSLQLGCLHPVNTVDGRNPANQLIQRLYHYLHGFLTISCTSGGSGFLPSIVGYKPTYRLVSNFYPRNVYISVLNPRSFTCTNPESL